MAESEIRGVVTDTICEECESLETTTIDSRLFELSGNTPTLGSKRIHIQCQACKRLTWARVHRLPVIFRVGSSKGE